MYQHHSMLSGLAQTQTTGITTDYFYRSDIRTNLATLRTVVGHSKMHCINLCAAQAVCKAVQAIHNGNKEYTCELYKESAGNSITVHNIMYIHD